MHISHESSLDIHKILWLRKYLKREQKEENLSEFWKFWLIFHRPILPLWSDLRKKKPKINFSFPRFRVLSRVFCRSLWICINHCNFLIAIYRNSAKTKQTIFIKIYSKSQINSAHHSTLLSQRAWFECLILNAWLMASDEDNNLSIITQNYLIFSKLAIISSSRKLISKFRAIVKHSSIKLFAKALFSREL